MISTASEKNKTSPDVQKVFYQKLSIHDPATNKWQYADEYVCVEKQILSQNKNLIVFNDERFTVIEKHKSNRSVGLHEILNDPRVRFNFILDGKGIFFNVYAENKPLSVSKIKKLISKQIEKEFGFYNSFNKSGLDKICDIMNGAQ